MGKFRPAPAPSQSALGGGAVRIGHRLGGVKLGTQINRVMVDREEMSDQ